MFFFAGERSNTMDINDIPPEVLTKIFSYLPQLDLLKTINTVCQYWNEVAFSCSLWKTIDVTYSTDNELDIYLQNIDHYREFVQNLLITRAHLITFFDIRKNRNLSNLRNLEMSRDTPVRYVDDCQNIVDLYPGIVAFKLWKMKSPHIFDCLSLLSKLQLRDFEIYLPKGAERMTLDKLVCEFIPKQPSLQRLSIHSEVMQTENIIKLLGHLKDLTCLHLSSRTGIDGYVFTALPELSKLTELYLSLPSVNDEDLKNIATNASRLKNLTLIGCKRLSCIGIEYITDGCHCLERLEIYSTIDCDFPLFPSTMESFGNGCKKLKYLAMRDCIKLDDSGVIALVQNCHDLEYLHLRNRNMSSRGLQAISDFCSNLFNLSIYGYDFNVESVESLLTKHKFIKYVSIDGCSNINTIDLCKSTETKSGILETHSHTRNLGIYGQTYIGYSAVEQIVTFCPDLRELALPQVHRAVRDDVIEIAFHKCRFLGTLILGTKIINRKILTQT